MTIELDIAEDKFKLFVQLWNKVENIGKNESEEIEISENQANSDFRYFVNKYDSTCNYYLCTDLAEFKIRYDGTGSGNSK